MLKQSFYSLSIILVLFLSACTKDDLPNNNYSTTQAGNNFQEPFITSYSNWTEDVSLNWFDGATTEPSRQFDIPVPELTQEELNAGGFVLVYAKSNIDGSIQPMPAQFYDLNNDETNTYSVAYNDGVISLLHTRVINGVPEAPADANEVSFRYIVVKPNTPDPNGRTMTANDLLNKAYPEVIALLGIPE